MRLTRRCIRTAHDDAMEYLRARRERILHVARSIARSDVYMINENERRLRVAFIYDRIGDHWAECDEETVWINVYKTFTPEALLLTLAHEELHGRVRRKRGGHALAEETEHRMMQVVDAALV